MIDINDSRCEHINKFYPTIHHAIENANKRNSRCSIAISLLSDIFIGYSDTNHFQQKFLVLDRHNARNNQHIEAMLRAFRNTKGKPRRCVLMVKVRTAALVSLERF